MIGVDLDDEISLVFCAKLVLRSLRASLALAFPSRRLHVRSPQAWPLHAVFF